MLLIAKAFAYDNPIAKFYRWSFIHKLVRHR
jgi:hypothetical protein